MKLQITGNTTESSARLALKYTRFETKSKVSCGVKHITSATARILFSVRDGGPADVHVHVHPYYGLKEGREDRP